MNRGQALKIINSAPHWHHSFEVFPGVTTPGNYDPTFLFDLLNLPDDLSGKRILEIGPSDGFFTLQLARRGADVTCVDYRAKDDHGYAAMERITGLKAQYITANIYDLDPAGIGTFDIILFLGVLYHLPDMMRALQILRSLARGSLFIETECDPTQGPPMARYYEAATLNGDHTNFWVPNLACVEAMCRDAGFKPDRSETWGTRGMVAAWCEPVTDKIRIAYQQG